MLADTTIDLGDRRTFVGIGDHYPAPVLLIARGRCLHRQLQAFQDHAALDRPVEIESLAYGPGGRQQLVDAADIHHFRLPCPTIAGRTRDIQRSSWVITRHLASPTFSITVAGPATTMSR
jgi:hypothetical protein